MKQRLPMAPRYREAAILGVAIGFPIGFLIVALFNLARSL